MHLNMDGLPHKNLCRTGSVSSLRQINASQKFMNFSELIQRYFYSALQYY